jgi:glucose 1-dehydrogenase
MIQIPTDGHPEQFASMVPMNRIGTPKEISNAVLWLFSNESSYVTGHTLMIDGGYCAGPLFSPSN